MIGEPHRLDDYLSHIIEAIERIERYTASMDEEQFLETLLIQDAVIRNVEVIGEASRRITTRSFSVCAPACP